MIEPVHYRFLHLKPKGTRNEKHTFRAAYLMVAALLIGMSEVALAEEPSGHVDLEVMSAIPGAQLFVTRIAMARTEAICPQQFGTIRITADGSVWDMVILDSAERTASWKTETTAIDDFTYKRRLATGSCKLEIDVREQVLKDGEWVSLLLPPGRRPNVASADRSRTTDSRPSLSPADMEKYRLNDQAWANAGSLRQGTGVMKQVLGFEGMHGCFEAVGNYKIDQRGITISFTTGLMGELNRFVIERLDIDDDHTKLSLFRGSCRVEFVIGASTLYNGSWVPVTIVPFAPSKARLHMERN